MAQGEPPPPQNEPDHNHLIAEYQCNCEYIRHAETQQWVVVGLGFTVVAGALGFTGKSPCFIIIASFISFLAIWLVGERLNYFARGRIARNNWIEDQLHLCSFRRFRTNPELPRSDEGRQWFENRSFWESTLFGRDGLARWVVRGWLLIIFVVLCLWTIAGGMSKGRIDTPAEPATVNPK